MDSLQKVFQSLKTDTDKIKWLNQILVSCTDTISLNKYATQVFALEEKSGYKKGAAITNGNLGNYYQRVKIDFVKSARYYTQCLKLSEELGDKKRMASCYLQLAITDGQFKNYETALDLLHKAEKINIEIKDDKKLKVDYQAEAQIYMMDNHCDSALYYFRKANSIPGSSSVFYATNYINLISAFICAEQFDSAISYIHKTDSIYHQVLHNDFGVLWNKMNYGEIYLIRGDVENALVNLEEAYNYAEKTNNGDLLLNVMPFLIDAYRKSGNSEKGFKVQTEWILLNDSLKATDKANAILGEQMKYEEEGRNKVEKLLNEKKEAEHNTEVQHQKMIIYSVSIFLVLVLGMSVFIFRSYREKKKANEIISHQKMLVDEKQKEILDSIHYAKRIQQSMMPTEKYIDKQLKKIK